MRLASPQLIALLQSSQFIMVDLYTFTLSLPPQVTEAPTVVRYSAGTTQVVANGFTYPLGPAFERGKTSTRVGTKVDELEVLIYPHINEDASDAQPTDMLGGLTWAQAAWQGVLDGAVVILERAFMASYGDTSPGTVVLFVGRVGDIEVSRTAISLKINSQLEILNIQMPRRLYQSPCTHLFGGPMCLFNRASMTANITAGPGSTSGAIVTSYVSSPASLYDQGTIIFGSGANQGAARTVTKLAGGVITVKPVFLYPVAGGDTAQLLPGCDRSFATCTNTFNNAIHFGGFDQVPQPETSV